MMFLYLIPPSPRYSESYVRVIALRRKQHAASASSEFIRRRNCDNVHLRSSLFLRTVPVA